VSLWTPRIWYILACPFLVVVLIIDDDLHSGAQATMALLSRSVCPSNKYRNTPNKRRQAYSNLDPRDQKSMVDNGPMDEKE
jgi:hypothetical protein